MRGALDSERIALRARLDETYRRAALEVREFVRPRSWLFGEHRATTADEAFLGELLEDSVTGALARTRVALLAAIDDAAPATAGGRAIVAEIDRAIDRFAAYARGVIDGGAVPDFFRHQLPRLRLEVGAIRDALVRRAPDPEEALFAPLRRELDALFDGMERDLAAAETDAGTRAALHAARLTRPLAALAQVLDDLERTAVAAATRSAGEREADDDGADREQRRGDDHDAVAEAGSTTPTSPRSGCARTAAGGGRPPCPSPPRSPGAARSGTSPTSRRAPAAADRRRARRGDAPASRAARRGPRQRSRAGGGAVGAARRRVARIEQTQLDVADLDQIAVEQLELLHLRVVHQHAVHRPEIVHVDPVGAARERGVLARHLGGLDAELAAPGAAEHVDVIALLDAGTSWRPR